MFSSSTPAPNSGLPPSLRPRLKPKRETQTRCGDQAEACRRRRTPVSGDPSQALCMPRFGRPRSGGVPVRSSARRRLLLLAEQERAATRGALLEVVHLGSQLGACAHFCSGRIVSSELASTADDRMLEFRAKEGRPAWAPRYTSGSGSRARRISMPTVALLLDALKRSRLPRQRSGRPRSGRGLLLRSAPVGDSSTSLGETARLMRLRVRGISFVSGGCVGPGRVGSCGRSVRCWDAGVPWDDLAELDQLAVEAGVEGRVEHKSERP